MKYLRYILAAMLLLVMFACTEENLVGGLSELGEPSEGERFGREADGEVYQDVAVAGTFGPDVRVPTSGRFRALVVFVRFRDDATVWDGCTPADRAWGQPDVVVPPFASNLLASDPTPPFPEASLTDYFYRQSQGRFTLYGDVYPRVLVTAKDEEEYTLNRTWKNLVLGSLTKELLDRINEDPAFDLGAYDANDDGYIDHVFFVLRKLNRLHLANGAAGVAFIGYGSQAPEYGKDPGALKRVHPGLSGSYIRYHNAGNIFPDVNLVRLMAHEFGHDLWYGTRLGINHVLALGGAHGVPAHDPQRVGYALMAGPGDARGDETISAYERDLLDDGWISCPVLTAEGRYTLSDLYSGTTATCYKLSVPVESFRPRTVYLSNRQRVGFFDRLRTNACTSPANEHGLKTTGLLVTAARSGRIAVLSPDNTLDLSIESRAYDGDMYGPETAVQVTPWTRPNINGYTTYPGELDLQAGNFQAIDNIHYTGGVDGEMAFDYVPDIRERPVIREDSWIGAETAGYDFRGDVVVTNESVLTIDTRLFFSGTVRIAEGSVVVIEAGGEVVLRERSLLEMADDTRLVVRGKLDLNGTLLRGRNAEIVYGTRGVVSPGKISW